MDLFRFKQESVAWSLIFAADLNLAATRGASDAEATLYIDMPGEDAVREIPLTGIDAHRLVKKLEAEKAKGGLSNFDYMDGAYWFDEGKVCGTNSEQRKIKFKLRGDRVFELAVPPEIMENVMRQSEGNKP